MNRSWIGMRRWRPLLSVFIAVCAGLTYAWNKPDTERKEVPLVIAPEALETGEVLLAYASPWTLPIRNPTLREITIIGWQSSCGCADMKPMTVSIPPGETVNATLTLDLT